MRRVHLLQQRRSVERFIAVWAHVVFAPRRLADVRAQMLAQIVGAGEYLAAHVARHGRFRQRFIAIGVLQMSIQMVFACEIFAAILAGKRLARFVRFEVYGEDVVVWTGGIAQSARIVFGRRMQCE